MRLTWMCAAPLLCLATPGLAADYFIPIFSNIDNWTYVGGTAADGGAVGSNDQLRQITNPNTGWWSATFTFSLPADYTNPSLVTQYYAADDRSVLLFNGLKSAVSVGIGAPALGQFVFTNGGAAAGWTFTYANGEINNATLAGGFKAGGNTIQLVVNNTNAGIAGAVAAPGPSSLSYAGYVKYTSLLAVVPEPRSWALMGAGMAAMGWRLRRRPARRHAPA